MNITYKYKVGQKVTLSKLNFTRDFQREKFFEKYLGKEVTIIARGFVYEDEGFNKRLNEDRVRFEMYYYIDIDPWYKNSKERYGHMTMIPESCLDGFGAWEEVDEQFISIDGANIVPFESRIYDRVIECHLDKNDKLIKKANCNFVFATEGTCVGIRKNYELSHSDFLWDRAETKEVKMSREFLTDFEPDEKHDWKTHPRQDAGAYGWESWTALCVSNPLLGSVYCAIPEDYAEIYVHTATTDKFLRKCEFNPFFDCNFTWEIKEWLTRYGVYDKVKELWEKYKPGENKKKSEEVKAHEKFLKTAHKFIDSLTDKQKEELRKMLQ